jgi:XTP/dITP diphosphohydrolase
MNKLLYGTYNKAKITSMKHMLKNINVCLLNDEITLPQIKIDECGSSPAENAKIKALAFYRETGIPVFSADTGLYFRNVEDKYQPGCIVRRAQGKYMNDEEMIAYYADLAKIHGGEITAYYQNAMCLVMSENDIYCYDGEDIHSEDFIITSGPHTNRTEGFPLDSLSIHIESGRFYMDLKGDSAHGYVLKKDLSDGICKFFLNSLEGVKRT